MTDSGFGLVRRFRFSEEKLDLNAEKLRLNGEKLLPFVYDIIIELVQFLALSPWLGKLASISAWKFYT